jgi:hypothetical protein
MVVPKWQGKSLELPLQVRLPEHVTGHGIRGLVAEIAAPATWQPAAYVDSRRGPQSE